MSNIKDKLEQDFEQWLEMHITSKDMDHCPANPHDIMGMVRKLVIDLAQVDTVTEPVGLVKSWANGSYSRKYDIVFNGKRSLNTGDLLFAVPAKVVHQVRRKGQEPWYDISEELWKRQTKNGGYNDLNEYRIAYTH